MTLIVYRDGVMAADMVVWSGSVFGGSREKIRRRTDGTMWATAGTLVRGIQFDKVMREWHRDDPVDGFRSIGAIDESEFAAIMVFPDGAIWRCDGAMHPYLSPPSEFYAIGSATVFLQGALAAGANAVAAIRLAQMYTDAGVRTCPDIQIEKLAR